MRAIRLGLVGVSVLLAVTSPPPTAGARQVISTPLTFRPTFTPGPGGAFAGLPTTDGRYVAIPQANQVLVRDQRSGRSLLETTAGQAGACHTEATQFAGDWLVSSCLAPDSSYLEQMYSLRTGAWRTVALSHGCVWGGGANETGGVDCVIGPVGSDWAAWQERCFGCQGYSGITALSAEADPWVSQLPATDPTTVLDFDAPSLTARICAPLRDTSSNQLAVNYAGQLVADQAPLGRYALARDSHGDTYLEQCGVHGRRRLPIDPVTGNPSELLSDPRNGPTLTGVFLPSLRRFVIHVPRRLLSPNDGPQPEILAGVELSDRTLYIFSTRSGLWQAPAPRAPRPAR